MFAKTMILTSISAAAMMLTTAATAAPTTTAGAAASAGKTLAKTSRADNPAQRYCIVNDITGSRIPNRSCDTLASWQDQGVDPRLLPRRR